ncbi:family 43 glycosylhydrolase [uncultured Sphingorhabdus sp.]|uniref:family 43 glycosylhydrolase n=1 Tax=uncultured Sphingorhabdus sp. TaxID=1686106 RepID=UPI00260ACE08|nr:family 43 glycosylhydrolase [uncultured Sphingorhabdus sp.]
MLAGLSLSLAARIGSAHARSAPAKVNAFKPGQPWLDTNGQPIQVRGSSIIKVGNRFYWYGENKERTTGKDRVWHWGMRMYSSVDLYNWDDLGTFIPPVIDDPKSSLHPYQFADRPHILFNKKTGKFVCWIKYLSEQFQTRTILTADKITGPYQIVASNVLPLGMGAGDFDLFTSPDDGKSYMAFERVHSEMIVADLDDSYTGLTGFYSTHWPYPGPPHTREGLAYFRRGEKHYMASSGTTGYFPNPSKVGVAQTFHGPWQDLGPLDRGDSSETSFNSQISSVFKVPFKKDLYIAIADRWFGTIDDPEFADGTLSRKVRKAFENHFIKKNRDAEDTAILKKWGRLNIDTSRATHVWLPVKWDGDRPWIEWRDSWSLDEFEDA